MNIEIQTTLALHNGIQIPRFGLGTARMKDHRVASQAVKTAIQHGYRLIDTSKNYENEEAVGQGIRESGVPENEIFLTTKLEAEDFGYQEAKQAFQGSLDRLGLIIIDLYLIHAPERDERLRTESWRALLELTEGEHLRAAGVSNYEIQHFQEIQNMGVELPTVNQIELSPFNYSKQRKLVEYCRERGIQVMAYSPLGVGDALDDPRLENLARRYGKTPAQLLIRWSLQHDFIVIPKSDQEDHIRENAQVFDFEISPADIKQMDSW